MFRWIKFVPLVLLMLSASVKAAITIEIVGFGANQIPIAIVPFGAEEKLPQSITAVVAADLQRSGLFRMVPHAGKAIADPADIIYSDWKSKGADVLVIGNIVASADSRYEVRFRLMDVVKQVQIVGFVYTAGTAQLRATAHRIADVIYEKLTGGVGVFSTRIAYITKQGKHYELLVSDADGFGAQTVLASNEPIISPAWSPDGGQLAYVSFENKKPIVYVQSLTTGKRKALAAFKGSNSAPAWSPDSSKLAVVLTFMGNSQIFLINADGTGLQRLTTSPAIDTEPNFSPDGQWLIFTSDRGGSPQIYRMPVSGGPAERLTFEGSYNVTPRYSPDGKSFVFIQRNGGRFNVAVQDFASRQVQVLSNGALDESPTFAPNGKMILYASEVGGRGILAAVSTDGSVKQRLSTQSGDVREPAWGPLQKLGGK